MSQAKLPIKSSLLPLADRKGNYDAILIQKSHVEYQNVLERIYFRENLVGLNFEFLTNKDRCTTVQGNNTVTITWRLYSARVNDKDRLLCLIATIKSVVQNENKSKQNLLIALEITPHDYDLAYIKDASCLKNRVLKMLPELMECMKNQGNSSYEKPNSDRSYMLLNLESIPELQSPVVKEIRPLSVTQKKTVTLSAEQEISSHMSRPGIGIGNAGTGKTYVALTMHLEFISTHPGKERDCLFMINTPFMKKPVKQLWNKMCADFRDKQDEMTRNSIPLNMEQRLCILTWEELIEEDRRRKEEKNSETLKKLKFTQKNDLILWYESDEGPLKSGNYRNYKTIHGSIPEFEALRKDLEKIQDAIMFISGYSEEEFLALDGEKQSPYQGEAFRKFLYREVMESFQKYCKKNHLVDERFFEMQEDCTKYALITVDESQNRSLKQLQSLFYCSTNGNIAYFMDSKQQLHANYRLFQRLKKWVEKVHHQNISTCILTTCYRSSRQVIDMMNHALQIRNKVCNSSKNEVTKVIAAKDAKEGHVSAVFTPDAQQKELLQKKASNPQTVVLVMHKDGIESAKKYYGHEAAVFCMSQAIGIEFGCVIIHDPFSDPAFSQLNEYLRKIKDGISIEKGEAHVNLLPGYLYTLISRAENEVIWVLPNKARNRLQLIESYGLETLSVMRASQENYTIKEREEQIVKFLIMGERETALQFFLKFNLGENIGDFEQFCKNNTIDKQPELPQYSIEELEKWLNEKRGLFNPDQPEKSRIAEILKDPQKTRDLLSLFKKGQITKLNPKEFCRFCIYALDPISLATPLIKQLVSDFIKYHPKGMQSLFMKLSAQEKLPMPAVRLKSNRRNTTAPQKSNVETSDLVSWLMQNPYGHSIIWTSRFKNEYWDAHKKNKEFFLSSLVALSTSQYGHRLLKEIINSKGLSQISEMAQNTPVELFSQCHLNLLYSSAGWEVYSLLIEFNENLVSAVILPEIASEKKIGPMKEYSFNEIINLTYILRMHEENNRKIAAAATTRPYKVTQRYIQDMINFCDNDPSVLFLETSWNKSFFYQLLYKDAGHPYLLSLLEKNPCLVQGLKTQEVLLQKNWRGEIYNKDLLLSDYWNDFKKVFCENNDELKKSIANFMDGEGEYEFIPELKLPKDKEMKSLQIVTGHVLSVKRTQYVNNILLNFCKDNVLNLLKSSEELLNTLLFTPLSCNVLTEKTNLLSKILEDSAKYQLFKKELTDYLKKLDPLMLANFLAHTESCKNNYVDFFSFILEKYDTKRNNMLTMPLSASSDDCLLKGIVMDTVKYTFYLHVVSQKEVLPTLDVFQLYCLFTKYASFSYRPTQKFFEKFIFYSSKNQQNSLLFGTDKNRTLSFWKLICNNPVTSWHFCDTLLEIYEDITSLLFIDETGCSFTRQDVKVTKGLPKTLFKALLGTEEGCNKLRRIFKDTAKENTYESHSWLPYIKGILGDFCEKDVTFLSNLCASSSGQMLLYDLLVELEPLSINPSLLYKKQYNYKFENYSPFEVLHRSGVGLNCLSRIINHDGFKNFSPPENLMVSNICDNRYSPVHVWNYLEHEYFSIETDSISDTKKTLAMEIMSKYTYPTEDFNAMVCLSLDWLVFASKESGINPLENVIRFKEHKSISSLLFSRIESMAFLFLELRKKPSISEYFHIKDLMCDPENSKIQPTGIFHPNLTQTILGKKLFEFLSKHNPSLKSQFIDLLFDDILYYIAPISWAQFLERANLDINDFIKDVDQLKTILIKHPYAINFLKNNLNEEILEKYKSLHKISFFGEGNRFFLPNSGSQLQTTVKAEDISLLPKYNGTN